MGAMVNCSTAHHRGQGQRHGAGWGMAQIVRVPVEKAEECHMGRRGLSHHPTNGTWVAMNGWHGGCIYPGTGPAVSRVSSED